MKISNSKKELARIISENGGWCDGAEFSVSTCSGTIAFSKNKPEYTSKYGFTASGGFMGYRIELCSYLKNWHQTILSREEYFHLYPVPDADGWIEWDGGECPVDGGELVVCKVRSGKEWRDGKAIMAKVLRWYHTGGIADIIAYRLHKPEQANPEPVAKAKPTIEQLAADYRNKLDYANRKQDEADKAKAESSAALSELEKAIAVIGFAITPICAVVQEHVTPNWRNWLKGDEIKCKKTPPGAVKSIGLTGYVSKVYGDCVEVAFEHHIAVAFGGLIDECFEFVNRPTK